VEPSEFREWAQILGAVFAAVGVTGGLSQFFRSLFAKRTLRISAYAASLEACTAALEINDKLGTQGYPTANLDNIAIVLHDFNAQIKRIEDKRKAAIEIESYSQISQNEAIDSNSNIQGKNPIKRTISEYLSRNFLYRIFTVPGFFGPSTFFLCAIYQSLRLFYALLILGFSITIVEYVDGYYSAEYSIVGDFLALFIITLVFIGSSQAVRALIVNLHKSRAVETVTT